MEYQKIRNFHPSVGCQGLKETDRFISKTTRIRELRYAYTNKR